MPGTVQCPLEKPVFVRLHFRCTLGRSYNSNLVWREDTLTKYVFAIALAKGTPLLHCKAHKETETVLTKNWSKAIALGPNSILLIPKNDDPKLSM